MRVHIEETSQAKVAKVLKATIDANGGSFIVNCLGSEGFMVAKAGSDDGKRLLRSRAAGLCGPFDGSWSVALLESRLSAAFAAYRKAYGKDNEVEELPGSASASQPVFIALHEQAFALVKSGQATTIPELCRITDRPRCTMKKSITRLKNEGRIVVKTPSQGGSEPKPAVWRVAA